MAAHLGQPYAKNRRDFVHCVVCTRGCISICFGAGRATQRRPAPNPTGLRTLRCVYAWLHMHMLRGRTRHAKTPCPNPTGLRTLRCVYAWLLMHMLRGRTRHAKTPCPQPDGTSYTALCVRVAAYAYASGQDAPRKDALPQPDGTSYTALCVRVAAYAYASGQDAPRKDALPPTRRDFVHCVVCTRGCISICFGAGRATQRRPAPNPTGLRTLRCVYAWLHMHMLRGRTRHAKTPCPNPTGLRTLRCVYAWLHMHMLRGRTRHAKTPCPQPDGSSYTALCVRLSFRPFRAIFPPLNPFPTIERLVFGLFGPFLPPLVPCF